MRTDCVDSYISAPFALVNSAIMRYNSAERRAQSAERRAQSAERRAQSANYSFLNLSEPVRGAAFFRIADNDAFAEAVFRLRKCCVRPAVKRSRVVQGEGDLPC
jgi:hypothetical protein